MEGMEGESAREYRSRCKTRVAFNGDNQHQFLNISAVCVCVYFIKLGEILKLKY